jgi:glycosyltransferase involved in cell wall biosynthesis
MKLLRIIHSLAPEAGGPVEGIHQISPLLAARGVTTTVVSLDSPTHAWLQPNATLPDGFTALGIGPGQGIYGYRRGVVKSLLPLIADSDAVVIHGIWQYHAFATWRSIRRAAPSAPPYWVYPHGMLDPWFKRTYPRKHLKKWLYWPWADYRVLRDATGVCFTSEQERLLARQSFWLYRAHELVVPYGLQTPPGHGDIQMQLRQRQTFFDRFPELTGQRLILCLARLHVKKGLDLLLEAFAPLARQDPSLHLMLAGPANSSADKDLKRSLIETARDHGVAAQVHLPGLLDGDLKWGALRSAELFAMPSHQENFGVAVVEALACGLPVLISTAINIGEEVLAAGAGLVQADTREATTTALAAWNVLSSEQRKAMAASASRLFHERFELNTNIDRLLALWQSSIQKR